MLLLHGVECCTHFFNFYLRNIPQFIVSQLNHHHMRQVNMWMKSTGFLHTWHAQETKYKEHKRWPQPVPSKSGSLRRLTLSTSPSAKTHARARDFKSFPNTKQCYLSKCNALILRNFQPVESVFLRTSVGLVPGARGSFPICSERQATGRSIPTNSTSRPPAPPTATDVDVDPTCRTAKQRRVEALPRWFT